MVPREAVRNQLDRRETHPVPYSLGFEGDFAAQLDGYYGSPDWRERLVPYLATSLQPGTPVENTAAVVKAFVEQ